MAILAPILGGGDVMKKISFGKFGHRNSNLWPLTGPFSALLYIASNVIAGVLIGKKARI